MNEKRIRQVVIWVVSVVAVVVTAGFAFAMWENFSDGPPPDTSDLMPRRVAIPDSENGFLVLNSGTFSVRSDYTLVTTDRSSTKKWDQAKVDAALASNAPALALFEKVMAWPGFQFKKPASYDGLDMARQLSHLLALSALNLWKRGDMQAAIEENFLLLEFGRRVRDGAGECSHFSTGVSAEEMAARNFCRFAEDISPVNKEDLKSIIHKLEPYEDHTEALDASIRADFAVLQNYIDEIASGKIKLKSLFPPSSTLEPPMSFQPNNTLAMLAGTFRQILREAPLFYDKIDREPGMMKTLSKMSKTDLLLSSNSGGRRLYVETVPFGIYTISRKCRATAIIRMTRALLAARCYWLDHGKLPATLDDLVPAYLDSVPLDPFDGKPLRYSTTDKVIYSIGKELTDHGGDLSETNGQGDKQPTVKIGW